MRDYSSMPKYIQMDDWIFEVKAVRALKVKDYGQPYNAISHITLNGDNAYIDGLMMRDDLSFTRQDFNTVIEFCRRIGVSNASFDRYKQGQLITEVVNLKQKSSEMLLQLVN